MPAEEEIGDGEDVEAEERDPAAEDRRMTRRSGNQ